MEQIIKQVQSLRSAQGLKPLANPAKLGKTKLEAALAKLKAMEPILTQSELIEEVRVETKVKKTEVTEVAPTEPKVKAKSIKEISCELLCVVETVSEEGRSIGMSYDQVLARVLELRPGAKTSLNCLRWYAGKIRVLADGYFQYKLPQLRMRPVSGKPSADEVHAEIVTDEA